MNPPFLVDVQFDGRRLQYGAEQVIFYGELGRAEVIFPDRTIMSFPSDKLTRLVVLPYPEQEEEDDSDGDDGGIDYRGGLVRLADAEGDHAGAD